MTNHEESRPTPHPQPHLIHFKVDNEHLETPHRTLTVREILVLAELDPATHYLIQVHGKDQIEHKDLEQPLDLYDGEKFISVYTGATPVS